MPRNNRNNRTSPKRVRIDDTTEETTNGSPKSDKVSPTSKAKLELERRIASHPMDMQSHLKSLGLDLINRRREYFNKKNIVKKMEEDNSYIPKSARIKFEIQFSDGTKSRAPQRITELQDKAKSEIDKFQAEAKKIIIAASKEERKTLEKSIQDFICKAIHQIIKIHLAAYGKECDPHLVFVNLQAHFNITLLVGSIPGIDTRNALWSAYKTVHTIATMPAATNYPSINDNMTPEQRASTMEAQLLVTQTAAMFKMETLSAMINDVLVYPWTLFIQQHDEN